MLKASKRFSYDGRTFTVSLHEDGNGKPLMTILEPDGSSFSLTAMPVELLDRVNTFIRYAMQDARILDGDGVDAFKATGRMFYTQDMLKFVTHNTRMHGDYTTIMPDDGRLYYVKYDGGDTIICHIRPLMDDEDGHDETMTTDQMDKWLGGECGRYYCKYENRK